MFEKLKAAIESNPELLKKVGVGVGVTAGVVLVGIALTKFQPEIDLEALFPVAEEDA